MNALNIALKDLQIFFKDRGAVVMLFLLPLLFIVVFSGALAAIGGSGEEEDVRILLPVVDLDAGVAAQTLLDGIDVAGGVRVERYAPEEAQALLEESKLARVLTVPANFTAGIASNRPVTLSLVNHPDAGAEETEAVRLVIEGVAQDMSLEGQILASLQQMGEMQANAPQQFQVFTVERTMAQARSQFERSRTQPLVELVQTVPGQPGIAGHSTTCQPSSSRSMVTMKLLTFIFLPSPRFWRIETDVTSSETSSAGLLGGAVPDGANGSVA